MKKIIVFAIALFAAVAAMAQTPEEIVSRMETAMSNHKDDGISMVIDIKIPILGSMVSTSYTLGDKTRVEADMAGVAIITWADGKTLWTYNAKDNEIEIKDWSPTEKSNSDGDVSMFENITDGYKLTIRDEKNDAWYLVCSKLKSNPDKDAPKTIDLVVAKDTYYPVSLSTKTSGITLTMRDVSFGVDPALVTFNQADYPTAKITDKRK